MDTCLDPQAQMHPVAAANNGEIESTDDLSLLEGFLGEVKIVDPQEIQSNNTADEGEEVVPVANSTNSMQSQPSNPADIATSVAPSKLITPNETPSKPADNTNSADSTSMVLTLNKMAPTPLKRTNATASSFNTPKKKSTKGGGDFLTRVARDIASREENKRRLRQNVDEDERKECSFSPKLVASAKKKGALRLLEK